MNFDERYMNFCEKHDLDVLLDVEEQLDFLDDIGNKRAYKILLGICTPKKTTQKPSLAKTFFDLVVDTSPAQRFKAECLSIDPKTVNNGKRHKNGSFQLGFAF